MITYRRNSSTATDIVAHLVHCDQDFIIPLTQRTSVEDYAVKLLRLAERFEAWAGEELVGLVAAYCNSIDRHVTFISSVSVLPTQRGAGIAERLVSNCIGYAADLGFRRVELRVAATNMTALRLYKRQDFRRCEPGESGEVTLWRDLARLTERAGGT